MREQTKPTIGFIGLGTMGAPMARRLLAAGLQVGVYDAFPDALGPFATIAGCEVCATAAAAAKGRDILITMLPTGVQVRHALMEQGSVSALAEGAVVVDMSTIDPDETLAIADTVKRMGRRFVDAPVCRGRKEAESGELLVLAGGAPEDVGRIRPHLDHLCEAFLHVGPVGSGIRLKLVNNYLSMVHMVLAAEGLAFAGRLGIDREVAFDLFSRTPAGKGQLLTNYPRKVLAGDVTPDFPLSMGFKDLSLALKLGGSVGAPLWLGAAARELYGLAGPWGRAQQDCTAMLLLLEDLCRARPADGPEEAVAVQMPAAMRMPA